MRIDDWEMRDDVQAEVAKLWEQATTDNILSISDLKGYEQDFLNLFGFGFDGVDYAAEADEMLQVKSINN